MVEVLKQNAELGTISENVVSPHLSSPSPYPFGWNAELPERPCVRLKTSMILYEDQPAASRIRLVSGLEPRGREL